MCFLRKIKIWFFIASLFGLAFSASAQTATINANTTNQFIRGFGASSAWHTGAYTAAQATIFWDDTTMNGNNPAGIGLSMLRCRIPPDNPTTGNSTSGSDITDTGEIAVMNQAKGMGLSQIWATEWSVPAVWKSNDSLDNGGTIEAADYPNYAKYLLDYVNYCQSQGVTLMCVSAQNEPDQNVTYESGIWTGQVFHDFISEDEGAEFKGNATKIMMPEPSKNDLLTGGCTGDGDATCSLSDAAAATYISFIGTHLYGSGPLAFADTQENAPTGVTREYWETEMMDYNGGAASDDSMTDGLATATLIQNSMSVSMNAYHYWWLECENSNTNQGLIDYDGTTVPQRTWCMGNFSRFIRPGYYRMGGTITSLANVSITAYKDNVGTPVTFVIVAINSGNSAANQTFTLSGITTTSVTPWLTDSSNNLTQQTAVAVSGGSFTYSMPVSSVVSFVGVNSATGSTNTFTPTPTNTPTKTATATATNSPTATRTNTATNTATSSATKTATPTMTNTVTNTTTVTASSTPTSSPTATRTNTVTNTTTSSPTRTPTTTATNTVVNTLTSTPSSTATSTATTTRTNTVTNTTTFSPTSTPTPTATNTVVNTLTSTPSSTATGTATTTRTNTVTNTTTFSPTDTTTATATNTTANTATQTPTATPTNTLANTATDTPTTTASNTVTKTTTSTPTNTLANTATQTATATPTNTLANTTTDTPTTTASNTVTKTTTSTPTNTLANTATQTVTSTPSNTVVNTPSNTTTQTTTFTPTNTLADTATQTPTATPTNTLADSATNTPTATASNTVTKTTTSTPTNTLANTATQTVTSTPSNTVVNTSTSTPTATASNTATKTTTSTTTLTPTETLTNTLTHTTTSTATTTVTFTITPTATPTAVTVQASQGSNPPSNSTQVAGASGVTIQQIQLTNPGNNPVTLSSLTLTEAGTSPTGITSVSLVDDGTIISTTSFIGSTATINFSNIIPPSNGAVTYQVVVNFSNSAATGNYTFSVTGGAGTNGQAVLFANMPVPGSVVTIVMATPSNTPAAATSTITSTATPTATSTGHLGVVVYPNPVTGSTVSVLPPAYSGVSDVQVEIFTIAFREVQEEFFRNVPSGKAVTLELTDKSGTPLADGIYYIVVIVDGHRSIGKMLIIR